MWASSAYPSSGWPTHTSRDPSCVAILARMNGLSLSFNASLRCPAAAGSRASASASPSSPRTAPRSSGGGGSVSARRSKRTAEGGAPSASASRAASRSAATTAGSSAGSLRSRWAPASVLRGPSSASSRPARRWLSARVAGQDALIDGPAQQRVHERQRSIGGQDLGRNQPIGGDPGALLVDDPPARDACRSDALSSTATDRASRLASAPSRASRATTACETASGRTPEPGRRWRRRLDAFGVEHADQLAQEEGIARAGVGARRAELGVGVVAEHRFHELGGGCVAERVGHHEDHPGLVAQGAQYLAARGRLALARGQRQRAR